jgi:phosphate transport system protein
VGKEHLSKQFDADLDDIRMELLEMGGKVELMIDYPVRALVERDSSLAKLVITTDFHISR